MYKDYKTWSLSITLSLFCNHSSETNAEMKKWARAQSVDKIILSIAILFYLTDNWYYHWFPSKLTQSCTLEWCLAYFWTTVEWEELVIRQGFNLSRRMEAMSRPNFSTSGLFLWENSIQSNLSLISKRQPWYFWSFITIIYVMILLHRFGSDCAISV